MLARCLQAAVHGDDTATSMTSAGQGGAAQAISAALQPSSHHGTVDSPSSSRAATMNPTPPFFCRQHGAGKRDVTFET